MLDIPRRQRLVGRSDLFQGMPEPLIQYVATHCIERSLDDRDVLFLKQDALEFLALVVEGRIYSMVHGPDGREQIVGTTDIGQVVGESALIDGHARETSAYACGPTRILLLGRRHFSVLCAEPLFVRRLLVLLMRRLQSVMELLEMVCLYRLESRLARFLLANMEGDDLNIAALPSVLMPQSQGILASMLNTSRPKLNVQLQLWRRLGLISSQRNRIVINDIDHLRRKACALN